MKAFLAFYITLTFVYANAQIPDGEAAKQNPPQVFVVPKFDNPTDGYYQGYLLLKEAEKFKNPEEDGQRLQNALATFQEVARKFPHWKKELVAARIKDVETRLNKMRIP